MGLTVDIAPVYDKDALKDQWCELQNRADASFFQSWTWIGAWLAVCPVPVQHVTLKDGDRVVALGLLGRNTRSRRLLIRARQLLLHETGDAGLDALFIEHNGFLTDRDYFPESVSVIVDALGKVPGWDEVVLNGVSRETATAVAAGKSHVEIDAVRSSFAVDLTTLRRNGTDWSAALSKNTATKLARARRFAERHGTLTLTAAQSVDEALAYFDELRVLHDARWHARHEAGAFSSPIVLDFHRRLIAEGFPLGQIELLRGTAGSELLGFLYNFRFRNHVSNYQSGFNYSTDNRFKPGLLMHLLAIARGVQDGAAVYDFLAGNADFKASLATTSRDLVWCRVQRPRCSLILERGAVALWRRLHLP